MSQGNFNMEIGNAWNSILKFKLEHCERLVCMCVSDIEHIIAVHLYGTGGKQKD